jgi:hypothetical protein
VVTSGGSLISPIPPTSTFTKAVPRWLAERYQTAVFAIAEPSLNFLSGRGGRNLNQGCCARIFQVVENIG